MRILRRPAAVITRATSGAVTMAGAGITAGVLVTAGALTAVVATTDWSPAAAGW